MSNTPLIETVGLKKYFKVGQNSWLHAVDDINLKIDEGHTLGVVGESGCGKSTLGRTVLQLLTPTEGQVLFNGKDITKCSKRERKDLCREMQIIFQDPYASLNPRMTVSEIIAQPLLINGIIKDKLELWQRVDELMDTVGLAKRLRNAYPHELDGGRRQRIGVARALSLKPKFIVCDEPVSALDVSIQAQILNLLMDLQDELGLTYVFITHDLSVVKHISDEIAVICIWGSVWKECPVKSCSRIRCTRIQRRCCQQFPSRIFQHAEGRSTLFLFAGRRVSRHQPGKGRLIYELFRHMGREHCASLHPQN